MIGVFLLLSELVQMFFGSLVLKWLNGRRNIVQALLLSVTLLMEVLHVVLYASFAEKPDYGSTGVHIFCFIQGTIIYSLYYMMCLCGPLDLAKVELLKANFKVSGMLFGLLCSFQCII